MSSHLPEKDTCQNLGAHSVSFLLIISDSQVPLFVLETIVSQRPLHVHHRHMYPKEESYIIVQPILKWYYTLTYNNFHHSATCIYKKKKKKIGLPFEGHTFVKFCIVYLVFELIWNYMWISLSLPCYQTQIKNSRGFILSFQKIFRKFNVYFHLASWINEKPNATFCVLPK